MARSGAEADSDESAASDHPDPTALALAARDGNRSALAEFIRVTQADVWRFVARVAGAEVADDLTQETYLRVLGALPAFEGRSSARTWLLAIARRVIVDRVRHDASRPRSAGPGGLEARWAPSADPASGVWVGRELDALSSDRRDALVLTQLMGFSYVEAAEICGCQVGTIRSRVARARADLIASLAAAAVPV